MINGTLFVDKYYSNNKIFEIQDLGWNKDNRLYVFYMLKEYFRKQGFNLSTQDINAPEDSQYVIFSDMPEKPETIHNDHKYLILFESEVIRKDNWDLKKHEEFRKIFTWNDEFVDNQKYFKINFSHKLIHPTTQKNNLNKKLCTLIAGNKYSSHPKELYSERVAAIRWFEKNHPDEFDLFGFGWDKFNFTGILTFLNSKKFEFFRKIFKPRYKSYRGQVESKYSTLSNYKFSICYENAIDIPGYITEKIFDCFFAGCVPIYLGPKNINEHIPPGTYIDKREFKSYEDLYEYISNMNDNEYNEYLENIRVFLESDAAYPFDVEYFASTIVSEILKDV